MALPHNIALAATGLDPENGLGVVKAWVESGGDVNGLFDPDASDQGRASLEIPQRLPCGRSFYGSQVRIP